MTTEELQAVLLASGLAARVKGEEVQVQECVFCGNAKWNLELSAEKGVYHCWACRTGGRIDKLLHETTGRSYVIPVATRERERERPAIATAVPDFVRTPLSEAWSASSYLSARGMEPLRLSLLYNVGVCSAPEHHPLYNRIVIPVHDYWTNAQLGWVGRAYIPPDRPKYISTMPRVGIVGWRWRDSHRPVVVVEGLFDGIAAHMAGYNAAVLLGTGGREREFDEFVGRLPPQQPLVIMLDADAELVADALSWRAIAIRGGAPVIRINLEAGEDPASIGPSQIVERVSAAPGIDWRPDATKLHGR